MMGKDLLLKAVAGKRTVKGCIADFGRAKNIALIDTLDRLQGNTTYMAPEGHHFSELHPIDHYKVDVFALGCVLYRLYYGVKAPWQDISYVHDTRPLNVRHNEHARRVVIATAKRRQVLAMKRRLNKEEKFEYLLLRMLDTDPTARPTAKEAHKALEKLS